MCMDVTDVRADRMLRGGLLALAAAGIGRFILMNQRVLSGNVLDGAVGFLYGVAIALMLVGIVKKARRKREPSRLR